MVLITFSKGCMEKDAGLEYGCVQAVIIPKSHTTLTEIIPLKCAERPTDNVQQSKGKSPTPIINSWWVRGNSALLPPSSISSLIINIIFLGTNFITMCMKKKKYTKPIPKEIANYMASFLTNSTLQDLKRERERRYTYQYCLSHECPIQVSIGPLFFLCLLLFLSVLLLLIIAFLQAHYKLRI